MFNFLEADQLFALTILPLLFAHTAPLKAKKKRWHPSKAEIKEGFIVHVKVLSNIVMHGL